MSAAPTPASHPQQLEPSVTGCFRCLDGEYDYWVDDIEGELPRGIRGTFLRNGPGKLKVGGQPVGHWFDGDGMVASTTFVDGRVHFKNRFVKTPKYLREQRAGRVLYRGVGTMRPGGPLSNLGRRPGNVANTAVLWHGGRLLALSDGAVPYELDPVTLETIGPFDYDGGLGLGKTFSPHGKIRPRTGEFVNLGMTLSGVRRGRLVFGLNLYRISPQGRVVKRVRQPVGDFAFCHDFAVTDRYMVVFTNSLAIRDLLGTALGRRPYFHAMDFDERKPCEVLVFDLETFGLVRRFELDPMVIIHYGNSFERDGQLIVDGMRFTDFSAGKQLEDVFDPSFRVEGGEYTRYTIDLARGTISGEPFGRDTLPCDFPQWDQRRTASETRYVYTGATVANEHDGMLNAIQRIDFEAEKVDVFELGGGRYTIEPMFIPRTTDAAEGDGWVAAYVYNSSDRRGEVILLDAANIEQQLAVIKLRHTMPIGFHGRYVPDVFLPGSG